MDILKSPDQPFLNIRQATERDAESVVDLYNWYLVNTVVTFETVAVSADQMRQRIQENLERYDWLVGEHDGRVVGYAYYGSFRTRAAYDHTVETTIYLAPDAAGKGFGRKLYTALLESAVRKGFREAIGVIALPNPASLALHALLGFHEVGVMPGVGYKFGEYVDVGFWQRSLVP